MKMSETNKNDFDLPLGLDKYETYYQQMYHQIEIMKKFKVTMDLSTHEKENQIDQFKKIIDNLNRNTVFYKIDNEKLKICLENNQEYINEMTEKMNSLLKIGRLIRSHLDDIELRMRAFEKCKAFMTEDYHDKLAYLQKLDSRIYEMEVNNNNEISELKNKNEKLKQDCATLIFNYEAKMKEQKEEIERRIVELNNLRDDMEAKTGELENEISHYKNELSKLEEKVSKLELNLAELQLETTQKSEIISDLEDKNKASNIELASLKVILNNKEEQEKITQEKLLENDETINTLNGLLNELQTELSNSITVIQKLTEENQDTSKKLDDLKQEFEANVLQLNESNTFNQSKQAEIKAQNEKIQSNTKEIEELKQTIDALKNEREQLNAKINQAEQKIHDDSSKIQALTSDCQMLNEKNESITNENKLNIEKLMNLESDKANIELKQNDTQFELNNLNEKLKDLVCEINNLNGKLELTEYNYTESCKTYENRIILINADNECLKNEIVNLERALQNELSNEKQLNEEINNLNNLLTEALNKCQSDHQAALKKKDAEINEFKGKIEKLTEIKNKNEAFIKTLHDKTDIQDERIIELQKKIEKLQESMAKNASSQHNNPPSAKKRRFLLQLDSNGANTYKINDEMLENPNGPNTSSPIEFAKSPGVLPTIANLDPDMSYIPKNEEKTPEQTKKRIATRTKK